jgi:hypothetical protein
MAAKLKAIALTIRGTLTETGVGPGGTDQKVIYQRCGAGFGNLPGNGTYNMQRRRYVIPTNTITPAVAARRQRLAAGVAAWKLTGPTERAAWTRVGAKKALPAYNAFVSAWLKAVTTTAQGWDAGATTWDNGSSTWDPAGLDLWDDDQATWDDGLTNWIN